jgi:hypothetical protein
MSAAATSSDRSIALLDFSKLRVVNDWIASAATPIQALHDGMLRFRYAISKLAAIAWGFEDAEDGQDSIPVAGGDGDAEEFIDLAQVGDGFHVAAVFTEEERVFGGDDAHEPWTGGGQRAWDGREVGARLGEDAYEADDVWAGLGGGKRIVVFHAEQTAGLAEGYGGLEGELAEESGAEFFRWTGLANDEGARGAHVDDSVGAQFFGEKARAKGSVAANVDASKESDQSHGGIVEKAGRLCQAFGLTICAQRVGGESPIVDQF